MKTLEQLRDKARNGKRLDRDEGRYLLTDAPLLEVGALANEVRLCPPKRECGRIVRNHPGDRGFELLQSRISCVHATGLCHAGVAQASNEECRARRCALPGRPDLLMVLSGQS